MQVFKQGVKSIDISEIPGVLEAGWAARPSKAAADSKAEFALAVVVVDIRSSNGVFSFIFKRPGGLPGPRKQRQTDWLRYR